MKEIFSLRTPSLLRYFFWLCLLSVFLAGPLQAHVIIYYDDYHQQALDLKEYHETIENNETFIISVHEIDQFYGWNLASIPSLDNDGYLASMEERYDLPLKIMAFIQGKMGRKQASSNPDYYWYMPGLGTQLNYSISYQTISNIDHSVQCTISLPSSIVPTVSDDGDAKHTTITLLGNNMEIPASGRYQDTFEIYHDYFYTLANNDDLVPDYAVSRLPISTTYPIYNSHETGVGTLASDQISQILRMSNTGGDGSSVLNHGLFATRGVGPYTANALNGRQLYYYEGNSTTDAVEMLIQSHSRTGSDVTTDPDPGALGATIDNQEVTYVRFDGKSSSDYHTLFYDANTILGTGYYTHWGVGRTDARLPYFVHAYYKSNDPIKNHEEDIADNALFYYSDSYDGENGTPVSDRFSVTGTAQGQIGYEMGKYTIHLRHLNGYYPNGIGEFYGNNADHRVVAADKIDNAGLITKTKIYMGVFADTSSSQGTVNSIDLFEGDAITDYVCSDIADYPSGEPLLIAIVTKGAHQGYIFFITSWGSEDKGTKSYNYIEVVSQNNFDLATDLEDDEEISIIDFGPMLRTQEAKGYILPPNTDGISMMGTLAFPRPKNVSTSIYSWDFRNVAKNVTKKIIDWGTYAHVTHKGKPEFFKHALLGSSTSLGDRWLQRPEKDLLDLVLNYNPGDIDGGEKSLMSGFRLHKAFPTSDGSKPVDSGDGDERLRLVPHTTSTINQGHSADLDTAMLNKGFVSIQDNWTTGKTEGVTDPGWPNYSGVTSSAKTTHMTNYNDPIETISVPELPVFVGDLGQYSVTYYLGHPMATGLDMYSYYTSSYAQEMLQFYPAGNVIHSHDATGNYGGCIGAIGHQTYSNWVHLSSDGIQNKYEDIYQGYFDPGNPWSSDVFTQGVYKGYRKANRPILGELWTEGLLNFLDYIVIEDNVSGSNQNEKRSKVIADYFDAIVGFKVAGDAGLLLPRHNAWVGEAELPIPNINIDRTVVRGYDTESDTPSIDSYDRDNIPFVELEDGASKTIKFNIDDNGVNNFRVTLYSRMLETSANSPTYERRVFNINSNISSDNIVMKEGSLISIATLVATILSSPKSLLMRTRQNLHSLTVGSKAVTVLAAMT
ncbi:MAG: hypothetical protein HQL32_06245 [Planctomycetes bacterium]|nr:hypothetical protein [Planctomycetota bacterium]